MALTDRPAGPAPGGRDAGPARRRSVEPWVRPAARGAGVEVWAADVDALQVTWSALPAGPVTVRAGDHAVEVDHPGGPGAVTVAPLPAATGLTVEVRGAGGAGGRRRARTLPRPGGEELARLATISDLHLGRGEPGLRPSARHRADPVSGAAGWPLRCATAAVAEAVAWGADHLVVKGDVCEETEDRTWAQAATALAGCDVPVTLLAGNHDTGRLRHFEPEDGAAALGLRLVRGVDHVDLPGLRVVLVDSCRPGNGWGAVARHAGAAAELVAGAPAALVATHHHAQRFAVPHFWPHGIPAPDARRFARAVAAASPRVLATSGHTHRCRTRRVAGLAWSEVAATNHFPAVWAGYRVFEGGLVQVVHRIARPDVLGWSEHTRAALRGVWALWATGTMSDRCLSLDWSDRPLSRR